MNSVVRLERAGRPTLCYRDEGKGEPVVLVHGVGGDSTSWDRVAPFLTPKFRVIRPDLSGHGRADKLRASVTIDDLARDVTDVMDALGIDSASMAGTSLGGTIIQAIALATPQRLRRAGMLSTVCGRTEDERAKALARIDVLKKDGLKAIATANRDRWFTEDFQRKNPDIIAARERVLLTIDPESYLHVYSVFANYDPSDRLGEIRTPTLIVTGEFDVAATPRMARLMHERIPGSRLEILPGLRHSLLIEVPERIAGLLTGFFT